MLCACRGLIAHGLKSAHKMTAVQACQSSRTDWGGDKAARGFCSRLGTASYSRESRPAQLAEAWNARSICTEIGSGDGGGAFLPDREDRVGPQASTPYERSGYENRRPSHTSRDSRKGSHCATVSIVRIGEEYGGGKPYVVSNNGAETLNEIVRFTSRLSCTTAVPVPAAKTRALRRTTKSTQR